jgi:phospholipid/cholesterol/gamma-HCH transport system substrate-binding protein
MADQNTAGQGGSEGLTGSDLAQASPTATAHREFRVGVFVILGVLSVMIALYMLTNPGTFRGRYMLLTQVTDAGGIRRGDPVQTRGVNIGQVHHFEVTPDGVIISLEIEDEWQVPQDSRVTLVSAGLMGGKVADISAGTSSTMAAPGTMLPGRNVSGLVDSTADLGEQASVLLQRADELLDPATMEDVQTSVRSLRELLESLNELTRVQGEKIAELTDQLSGTMGTLDQTIQEAGPPAASAMARADSTMVELRATSESLREATASLQVVLDRMERGEGTLGRLSTDDTLYEEVTTATESLRLLLDDFRENPRRYVNISIF